jgi:hypothetical protein
MVNLKSIVGVAAVLPESKQMTSFGLAPRKSWRPSPAGTASRGQSTEPEGDSKGPRVSQAICRPQRTRMSEKSGALPCAIFSCYIPCTCDPVISHRKAVRLLALI